MEQTSQKNAVSFLLVLALIFGLKWINAHWLNVPLTNHASDSSFSYEMPRPKSYVAGFDLSGRDIDHEVLTDEEIKTKAGNDVQLKAKLEAQKKAALAKKAADEAKKKQAKIDKATLSVATVDTSMDMGGLSNSNSPNANAKSVGDAPAGPVAVPQQPEAAAASSSPTNNEPQYSAAEWLTLLGSHATSQLVAEFDQEHMQGMISNTEFYTIAFTLFNSQIQQQQQTGTEILTDDNSSAGLLNMAQQYPKETGTSQTNLWTIIQTFAQPIKFNGLNVALASTDTTVVPTALKVLAVAVQNAQQQVNTQGNGGNRNVAGSIQPSALLMFDKNLSQIANAGGANAQQAQSLLSQIQVLNQ